MAESYRWAELAHALPFVLAAMLNAAVGIAVGVLYLEAKHADPGRHRHPERVRVELGRRRSRPPIRRRGAAR